MPMIMKTSSNGAPKREAMRLENTPTTTSAAPTSRKALLSVMALMVRNRVPVGRPPHRGS
jgi:hypothetical protein